MPASASSFLRHITHILITELNFSRVKAKLPDALQDEINQELEKELVIEDNANLGKSFRVKDANGRYMNL